MKLVIWCGEDTWKNIKGELKDDELINLHLLKKNELKDIIINKQYMCILLLDGNYENMYKWSKYIGYTEPRIIDYGRYRFYKNLEQRYNNLSDNTGEYIIELYNILQKVINKFEKNEEVVRLCKTDYINRLKAVNISKFWNI